MHLLLALIPLGAIALARKQIGQFTRLIIISQIFYGIYLCLKIFFILDSFDVIQLATTLNQTHFLNSDVYETYNYISAFLALAAYFLNECFGIYDLTWKQCLLLPLTWGGTLLTTMISLDWIDTRHYSFLSFGYSLALIILAIGLLNLLRKTKKLRFLLLWVFLILIVAFAIGKMKYPWYEATFQQLFTFSMIGFVVICVYNYILSKFKLKDEVDVPFEA